MKRVALLIGVSEYEGLSPLPSAVDDIDALYGVLVDPERGQFLAEDVTLLPNPNRQEMDDAIYKLFHERQKDDLLLLYFSGHGIKDDKNQFYLGTKITKKNNNGTLVPTSAVAAASIHDWIEHSKSEYQVIILDACFSGAIAKGMRVKDDATTKPEDYLGGKGRAILTSSTATEYSLVEEPTKHDDTGLSTYTRYLVEGIATGAADLDEDDWISVDELHEYASKKVKQASPTMTPKFYPVEEGYKILLSKSRRDDPKLKYEREFQRQVEKDRGNLSIPVKQILTRKQTEWGISPAEAKVIEDRVLQPYQEKLAEYEQTLTEMQREYPFGTKVQADLKEYQEYLKLRDEDIVEIDRRVLPQSTLIGADQIPDPNNGIPKLSVIEFTSVKVDDTGKIIDRPKGKADFFVEDLGNGVSLIMMKILGGEFMMGSLSSEEVRWEFESPPHKVNVPEFYMGQTLVTQSQWQQIIMENNPSSSTRDGKLPVEMVCWWGANEFCQKLSQLVQRKYRLPSEAEWEYACRARTTTPFYFGETITSEIANYCAQDVEQPDGTTQFGTFGNGKLGDYRQKITPVDKFPPNLFGLYDMHGNLWEWCLDHWHDNYKDAPLDGSAWLSDDGQANRVLRGGSLDCFPRLCRSATRTSSTPDQCLDIFGFRVVCEIPRSL